MKGRFQASYTSVKIYNMKSETPLRLPSGKLRERGYVVRILDLEACQTFAIEILPNRGRAMQRAKEVNSWDFVFTEPLDLTNAL